MPDSRSSNGSPRSRLIVLNPFERPLSRALQPARRAILRCGNSMAAQSMTARSAASDSRWGFLRPDGRRIAPLLLIVVSIILARNLLLESPLMAGDEYAYFAAAQTFPHSGERFAFDPYLPRIYSPAFAAY